MVRIWIRVETTLMRPPGLRQYLNHALKYNTTKTRDILILIAIRRLKTYKNICYRKCQMVHRSKLVDKHSQLQLDKNILTNKQTDRQGKIEILQYDTKMIILFTKAIFTAKTVFVKMLQKNKKYLLYYKTFYAKLYSSIVNGNRVYTRY